VKTWKTFRWHWESLGTVQRNEFLRSADVRVEAHKDKLPPLKMRPGPLTATGLDVPRTAIIDDDDLKAVVHLGGLADLLDLASAA